MKKYFKNKYTLSLLITISFVFPSQFGKNIVQYDEFDWHYTQTDHFDVYVSDSSGYHLSFIEKHAEDAYNKIQSLLNWSLKDRVSIIVHGSHNEFQQTNVISSHLPEGVGGVTELLKNRIVIPFDGSHRDFKHVIYHELVHAFINDCVYGGSLKSMMSNSIEVRIPLWMNEGLAEYIAEKWSSNSDMWIRDMVLNGENLPHINQLGGYWAYRGGQSVWNFITDKWGEESISEIIKQIKAKGNVNLGVKSAISITVDELSDQWHKYLKKQYWPDINNKTNISEISFQITDHEKLRNHYNIAPTISPNGKEIALFSDRKGIINLYLMNATDGKFIKRIIKGQRTLEFEEMHILKPGITWSPDGEQIAVAVKSGKSDALIFINLGNNKKEIKRFPIKGIFRPTWHPNKNIIAFIGNDGFSSDIYLYDIDKDSLINYTNDWFSDDQVSWDEKGENLYFISNRDNYTTMNEFQSPDDSLIININLEQHDIYSINIATDRMTRHTNTDFNESYPHYSNNDGLLAYISDKNGINNIYLKSDSSNESTPITNILTGVTQLSWNTSTNQMIFTGFNNSGYDTFTIYNPKEYLENSIELIDANWIKTIDSNDIEENNITEYINDENDDKVGDYSNYDFSRINYTSKKKQNTDESIDSNSDFKKFDITKSLKIFKYKTRFTLDFANVDYGYNSVTGSTGLVNILFSDILGNHRILINTEMQIKVKSSDYLIKYYNLSKRTNWLYSFYHYGQEYYDFQTVEASNGGMVTDYFPSVRYQFLGLTIDPSYAINRFQRLNYGFDLRANSKQDIIWSTYYNNSEQGDKDYFKVFLIPSLEYTFDNTLWQETYPVEGRRMTVKYISSVLGKESQSLNFNSLVFDFRHYKSIANGVSTAFRFYGGTFGGKDALESVRFRVGGTSYLPFFNNANYSHVYDVHSLDQVYYDVYVMPVRGLPIGAKHGQNVLLMNSELRMPFLMYYFPWLGVLGKINGVLFSDIAVIWNKNSEFPDIKAVESWDNVTEIDGYKIYPDNNAENLSTQDRLIDPLGWVWTFGLGPRFILFGMPWQADIAWQYNPVTKEMSSARWYLSIGLDF